MHIPGIYGYKTTSEGLPFGYNSVVLASIYQKLISTSKNAQLPINTTFEGWNTIPTEVFLLGRIAICLRFKECFC